MWILKGVVKINKNGDKEQNTTSFSSNSQNLRVNIPSMFYWGLELHKVDNICYQEKSHYCF